MNAGNGSLRAFTAALDATDRPEAIVSGLARFVRGFRLPAVFIADLTTSGDNRAPVSGGNNWPLEWRLEYERMGGIAQDVTLQQARLSVDPYRWSDGITPALDKSPGPSNIIGAARRFAEQNDLTWREGLYFPVHWPPGGAGVVVFWGDPPALSDDDETRLHMASCRAHWRWRQIQSASPDSSTGEPEPPSAPVHLGQREIEVLSLIAAGNTDAAAARVLGLTERTILHYVARARTRLGCRTRAQAIAVSVRLGLI